jgi:hypothetical protein
MEALNNFQPCKIVVLKSHFSEQPSPPFIGPIGTDRTPRDALEWGWLRHIFVSVGVLFFVQSSRVPPHLLFWETSKLEQHEVSFIFLTFYSS